MNCFRPDFKIRAAALAGAVALTAGVAAGVARLADVPDIHAPISLTFTGETTPNGPVYRMPPILVAQPRPLEAALPQLIDRVLVHFADRKPGA